MPAALITGAAIRVGQGLAMRLAHRGYDVALHYNSSPPDDTLDYCQRVGVKAKAYPCDLSDLAQVETLVDRVHGDFTDLSVLVNSAANFIHENIEHTSRDTLEQSLRINLMAPYLLMREYKRRVNRGLIVNIIDERVERTLPAFAAYSVSKVGLAHLTRLAAREWGQTVRVNGIAPGLILPPAGRGDEYLEQHKTDNPMHAHGSVEDLARALEYLLDSPFVNGDILFVDGGESLMSS